MQENQEMLLAAILPQPSGVVEMDRFQHADVAVCGAECSGKCMGSLA